MEGDVGLKGKTVIDTRFEKDVKRELMEIKGIVKEQAEKSEYSAPQIG